jgi:lipopolysaccharide export system protein LptC
MHPARFSPAATLFPLVLIGMLAGLTYWLDMTSRQQETGADGRSRHDPDYYIEHFEIRHFNKEGRLQHTLRADRMTHYPDDDSTDVLMPHLTYHRDPPTYVSSQTAHLDSGGDRVELVNQVHVTREGAKGKPPTELTTDRLEAFPDEEIARTQSAVLITQGQSQVSGSGLKADNSTATYVLEGPVRGVFYRKGRSTPANVADATQATVTTPPAAKALPAHTVSPRAASVTPSASAKSPAVAKRKSPVRTKPKTATKPKPKTPAHNRAKP